MQLKERHQTILKFIVEHFIKSAQPIGSEQVIRELLTNLSSATIRNDFVVLEKAEYIQKQHTSSGRIPTTKGYEYYLKYLLVEALNPSLVKKFEESFPNKLRTNQEIIDHSLNFISEIAHVSALVKNSSDNSFLEKMDLIPIKNNKIVILLVNSEGQVINRKIDHLPNFLSISDMQYCTAIFNERLKGTLIKNLEKKAILLKPLLAAHIQRYETALQIFIYSVFRMNSAKESVIGTSNLLSNPEFKNVQKFQNLVHLIKSKSIFEIIAKHSENERLQKNNIAVKFLPSNKEISEVSVISANLQELGENKELTIIGPQRMNYKIIISFLNYIIEKLKS